MPGAPGYSFFGVFDGHGGKYISEEAAKGLLEQITATAAWKSGDRSPEKIREALREGFLKLDKLLEDSDQVRNRDDHSGSTAITALVTPTHIFVANCGDSRAILVTDNGAKAMSEDHKPYNEEETKRIEAAGGTVTMKRVNGDLAVSRALGDFVYKRAPTLPPEQQAVSCEPEIRVHERLTAVDQFLVLACDGVRTASAPPFTSTALSRKRAIAQRARVSSHLTPRASRPRSPFRPTLCHPRTTPPPTPYPTRPLAAPGLGRCLKRRVRALCAGQGARRLRKARGPRRRDYRPLL